MNVAWAALKCLQKFLWRMRMVCCPTGFPWDRTLTLPIKYRWILFALAATLCQESFSLARRLMTSSQMRSLEFCSSLSQIAIPKNVQEHLMTFFACIACATLLAFQGFIWIPRHVEQISSAMKLWHVSCAYQTDPPTTFCARTATSLFTCTSTALVDLSLRVSPSTIRCRPKLSTAYNPSWGVQQWIINHDLDGNSTIWNNKIKLRHTYHLSIHPRESLIMFEKTSPYLSEFRDTRGTSNPQWSPSMLV